MCVFKTITPIYWQFTNVSINKTLSYYNQNHPYLEIDESVEIINKS